MMIKAEATISGSYIVSSLSILFSGFLSTGDEALEGNYGLLDQIAGLQWVKKNIQEFRGNSSSVTIFGNSAGAASVALLYLSPNTEGKGYNSSSVTIFGNSAGAASVTLLYLSPNTEGKGYNSFSVTILVTVPGPTLLYLSPNTEGKSYNSSSVTIFGNSAGADPALLVTKHWR